MIFFICKKRKYRSGTDIMLITYGKNNGGNNKLKIKLVGGKKENTGW